MGKSCDDEEIVAFHEAAHAVIASHLGGRVAEVRIETTDRDGKKWKGHSRRQPGGFPPACVAIEAFAGALSDIKIFAQRQLKLDSARAIAICDESVTSVLDALLRVYAQRMDEDSEPSNEGVFVTVRYNGELRRLDEDVWLDACEIDIEIAVNAVGLSPRHLVPCLLETRDLIDTRGIWEAIEALAKSLLESQGRRITRKELSGVDVSRIMNESDGS
jgi:hypothetical protein